MFILGFLILNNVVNTAFQKKVFEQIFFTKSNKLRPVNETLEQSIKSEFANRKPLKFGKMIPLFCNRQEKNYF